MNSGQVVIWDCRVSSHEQLVSNHESSHRDQINCLVWFQSKTNSEFFTGSTEGQLCWWDIRKIDKPTDRTFLDPMKNDPGKLSRAFAISAIDSDPSIATKYMAGTEQGVLFTCRRLIFNPVNVRTFKRSIYIQAIAKEKPLARKLLLVSSATTELFVQSLEAHILLKII